MSAADRTSIPLAEAKSLFAAVADISALVLAVSGGPDSTALLVLAARWRASLKKGPKLLAVTIDHGLRADSAREAKAVARLARSLGVAHRIVPWRGKKPSSGLQNAAREMRYRLLGNVAKSIDARHVVTAHTRDDQAETVLFRLARGSGLSGLAGMARMAPLPVAGMRDVILLRPFLDLPKARLIATLRRAKVDFADDPSNRDPRFTRARLRGLAPSLEAEGLSAERLSALARRVRRAESALDAAVEAAALRLARKAASSRAAIGFDADAFRRLPEEVALRLLGRTIAVVGDEGPVELGKLESLLAALFGGEGSQRAARRTLAGAVVTRRADALLVERAPPRRGAKRAEFRP